MKTQLILEILKKTGRITESLLNIFLSGYDYKKMKRRVFYPTLPDFSKTDTTRINPKLLQKEKHKFYSLLSRLKRQGFVEKKQKGNKTWWTITSLGREKLEKIKITFHFPLFNVRHEKDNDISLIVFDIPEKHRAKRDWLRSTLLALGFTMLQKSVWIGRNKLPEEFLNALAELDLIDSVHIFKITQTGTLKKLNL